MKDYNNASYEDLNKDKIFLKSALFRVSKTVKHIFERKCYAVHFEP